MRTYTSPELTPPMKPPPAWTRVVRTPGTLRRSWSIARITWSIAPMLAPSGAVTRTSNSASSTSDGMYSCFTMPYSGIEDAITATASSTTHGRWRSASCSALA
jgi:hypothetical protein